MQSAEVKQVEILAATLKIISDARVECLHTEWAWQKLKSAARYIEAQQTALCQFHLSDTIRIEKPARFSASGKQEGWA